MAENSYLPMFGLIKTMTNCLFVSDLHGKLDRYDKLFGVIKTQRPAAVFLGGDLFPSGMSSLMGAREVERDFLNNVLAPGFSKLKHELADSYPRIFLILGNDDGRMNEEMVVSLEGEGLWSYIHQKKSSVGKFTVYGYACIPPTPFLLKDWERYDVSRFVDPGCVPPEEGWHSVPVSEEQFRRVTIQADLTRLAGTNDLTQAIFLFHAPPYKTNLDRAALDGKSIEHVALDVRVGSIAIRRFIETHQPLLTLHGHVHESARMTGSWKERIGRTFAFSAAHDGPELALVRFDLENLEAATRVLL